MPIIAPLEDLDEKSLVRILEEPKNAITKQYTKLMAMDGIDIIFEKNALSFIAKVAQKRKIGARALRSIMESLMLDHMFNAPTSEKKQIKISQTNVKEYIKKQLSKDLQDILLKK